MKSFIVVDGGGTKSEVLLVDVYGHIYHRLVTNSSNPNDVTMDVAFNTLLEAIQEMIIFSEKDGLELVKIYLLIAGIEFGDSKNILKQRLEEKIGIECVVDGDLASVKEAGLFNQDNGVVVISGTGFNLAIKKNGAFNNIAGWGYLVDDYLSGFDLGRDALIAASRAISGVTKPTVLVNLLEKKFGHTLWYSMAEIYEGGVKKIASLSQLVIEAYLLGDEVSRDIVDKRLNNLAKVISLSTCDMPTPINVVLFGGIFENNKFMRDNLANILGKDYVVIVTDKKTIYGAAYFAMKDLCFEVNDSFIKTFDDEYQKSLMD